MILSRSINTSILIYLLILYTYPILTIRIIVIIMIIKPSKDVLFQD